PITEPSGQVAGLALNVCSGHAFWIVVSREGSSTGNTILVLTMLACPGAAVTFTNRLVPLTLVKLASVVASSFGANGSLSQPVAWNGTDIGALVPSSPVSVVLIALRSQLVGLNWNGALPGRCTVTSTRRNCTGAPIGP